MSTIASQLHPKRAIFVTDVDGVYDRPPELDNAKLLPLIRVDNSGNIVGDQSIESKVSNSHDVTGGNNFHF
jgi:isopentenyl phosphate kinase